MGTPYWMAPEVIEMSAFTTASDIWSLGCTIIELLQGEPPYYELKPITALYRIVQDEHPPLPADLSPPLLQFLTTCFTRDPVSRPAASRLRQHAWLVETEEATSGGGGGANGASSADGGTGDGDGDAKLQPNGMPQRIGQLAVQTMTTLRPRVSRNPSREETEHGYDSNEGTGSRVESTQDNPGNLSGQLSASIGLPQEGGGSANGSRQSSRQYDAGSSSLYGSRGGSRQVSHQESRGSHASPRQRPDTSPVSTPTVERNRPAGRGGGGGGGGGASGGGNRAAAACAAAASGGSNSSSARESGGGGGGGGGGAEAMRRAGRAHSSPAGANPQSAIALPPSLVSGQTASAPGAAAAAPAPAASAYSPEQQRPPRRSSKENSPPGSSGGATSERHEALRWVVEQEERSNGVNNGGMPLRPTPIPLSPPRSPHLATHPTSDSSSHHLFAPPPAAARVTTLLPPAAPAPPAAAPAQPESPPPYPYSLLQELQSQQQPSHDFGVQMPLVGFLWKRGTSWRSFAYQRRFFYLTEDALCYRQRAPPADQQGATPPGMLPDRLALQNAGGEKRIPLTSVTCVRMHSKLKYEFELICTSRSYRLRAPSAQALALWVTAISSEWLQLRSLPTMRDAAGGGPARSAPSLLMRGAQQPSLPGSDWDLSVGSGGHSLSSHNTLSSSINSCGSLNSLSSSSSGGHGGGVGGAMPPPHHYRPSQQQLHAPAPAALSIV